MFATARVKAKRIVGNKNPDESGASQIEPEALPKSYTLSQLKTELDDNTSSGTKQQILETVVILESCLANPIRLSREPGDEEHITSISIWISKSILPDGTVISHSDIPSESDTVTITNAITQTQRLATHGLQTLKILLPLLSPSTTLNPSILLTLIVFSSRDVFTTPSTISPATALLSTHTTQITSPTFIVNYILQKIIRPLFSKSQPSTITSTGRKAAFIENEPLRRFDFEAEKRDKGWKYQDVWAVSVLEWTVSTASEEIITQNWNLFIPPLLTLLDDPSTPIRSRGLDILSIFLPKFPSKLLHQTGLGPVFEDAIFPTLLFLPSVTPVEESCVLLPSAYAALEVLGRVRFSPVVEAQKENADKKEREEKLAKEKKKFLDKVMRKGILMGWSHAREYPDIVTILLAQLGRVVGEMGIDSVKHLKDTIPMISTALMDPFTPPSLLQTALEALSSVIQNAWPRISEPAHRRGILMALVICWKNLETPLGDGYKISENSEKRPRQVAEEVGFENTKGELRKVGKLFVAVVQGQVDMKTELKPLIEAQPGLREVFAM